MFDNIETASADAPTISKTNGKPDNGPLFQGPDEVKQQPFEYSYPPIREWPCMAPGCTATTENYYADGWTEFNGTVVLASIVPPHEYSTTLVCPQCAPDVEARLNQHRAEKEVEHPPMVATIAVEEEAVETEEAAPGVLPPW